MAPVPTLTDGRVTLRAHGEDDVEACLEQCLDPLTQRWTRVPVPYTPDDAKRFVRHAMPGGWQTDQEWGFAVEALDATGTARYAGTVTLRNQGDGLAEVAYGTHPWARGRGIVEPALRLLLEWGFTQRGIETVLWKAEVGNWASRKAAWRVGFSCDATLRASLPTRDAGLRDGWIGTLGRHDPREPRTTWFRAPVIEGDRVRLRPCRDEDVARVVEACNDPVSVHWLGQVPVPYGEAEATAYLLSRTDAMAKGTAVHWGIAEPATDQLLGAVSVFSIDSSSGPEVGYWAHPDARGRGVVREAVALAVRHAFIDVEDGGLGLTKLRLVAAVDNVPSRSLAVANGFREAGVERSATICRDGPHDAAIYDLTVADLPIRSTPARR